VRILEKGESSQWWRSVRPEGLSRIISSRRAHLEILRKTGFHGRKKEIRLLEELLHTVDSGAGGRVAVIRGEPGVGKTRLLDRLIERMDETGRAGDVVMVPGLRSEIPVPYFAFITAVLAALDLSREEDRTLLRERLRAKLEEIFPNRKEAAEVFTNLLVSILPEGEGTTLSPEEAAHLFTDFFASLAQRRTLILVVEDIQGAGHLTRNVILEAARHIQNARVLMLLTVRTGETPTEQSEAAERLQKFLAEIQEQGNARLIDLNRLEKEPVREMLVDLGFQSRAVEGAVADRIFDVTEGNPYFVLEVANLLIEEGALNLEDPDWFGLLRHIPASIQDFFYRRLFKLAPEERRFLDFASIFGLRFRVGDIVAAEEMDLAEAARVTSRLQHIYHLIRPTMGAMHRFDHVLIREMIYENLEDEVRRNYHCRVAGFLERQSETRTLTGRECLKAAVHYARGSDHAGALRFFFQAYDYLAAKGAHQSALVLAREAASHVRALREPGGSVDRHTECRIYLRQARVAAYLGRRGMEFQALKEAATAAGPDSGLRARVSLSLGKHYLATSRFISALNSVQAALRWMRESANRPGEADALQTLAEVLRNLDEDADTEPSLDEALAIRKELDDASGQARILTDMGMIHLERGDQEQAEKVFRESLELFRTAEDEEGVASILRGLGALHRERGRLDLAETALRRAVRIAHRLGQSDLRGRVQAELGECLLETNDLEGAAQALAAARHVATDTKNTRLLITVLAALARLESSPKNTHSDGGQALSHARQAVALANQAELSTRDRVNALSALASVFLQLGKSSSALAITRKATRLVSDRARGSRIEKEVAALHEAARGRME
jgi:tetratricopeptide (TPR) repeat protein